MATRAPEFGIDVAIKGKLNAKYTDEDEALVRGWIEQLTGVALPAGRDNVQAGLKDGQVLVKLANAVYEKTPSLPDAAKKLKYPFRSNTMSAPFKQMENIQTFLSAAEAYGLPKTSSFQTVDLYENRNMAQVLLCIIQLGSECQRNGFGGPVIGPKPSSENRRAFTDEQLRSQDAVIGLQMGSNRGATQAGMSFGTQRHINDIKVDAPTHPAQPK